MYGPCFGFKNLLTYRNGSNTANNTHLKNQSLSEVDMNS